MDQGNNRLLQVMMGQQQGQGGTQSGPNAGRFAQPGIAPNVAPEEKIREVAARLQANGDADAANLIMTLGGLGAAGVGLGLAMTPAAPAGGALYGAGMATSLAGASGMDQRRQEREHLYNSLNTATPGTEGSF